MRLRFDNELGQIAAIDDAATEITFTATPGFPTIAAPDYVAPSAPFEIVHLTAYTAGELTGTIARGQEDTVAAAHDGDAPWLCGPTSADFGTVTKTARIQYTGGGWPTDVTILWDEIGLRRDATISGVNPGFVFPGARLYTLGLQILSYGLQTINPDTGDPEDITWPADAVLLSLLMNADLAYVDNGAIQDASLTARANAIGFNAAGDTPAAPPLPSTPPREELTIRPAAAFGPLADAQWGGDTVGLADGWALLSEPWGQLLLLKTAVSDTNPAPVALHSSMFNFLIDITAVL